jgi:glycosyltransferase involved in cell wall biosynthesis
MCVLFYGNSERVNSKNGGERMRVMMLASGDLWAGAEVMVYQLVCGLVTVPEIKLCVVLLNNERLANELRKLGIEVHVIAESKNSFLSIARILNELVAVYSPDIIHSHRYKENVLALLTRKVNRRIRLISTQHGMPELVGKDQGISARLRVWLLFRLLSSFFNRTVLVSEEMRRSLVGSFGFTSENVNVIHNGIDLPAKCTEHSNKIITQKRITIGSAGRFSPVKDFSLLVDSAKMVIAQNHMVDFALAGDGPERQMLEGKVREAGIQDHFKFLGHQNDMDSFYNKIDIYINTSVHEGIPMSVLEAMSHMLPVIVPKVGGFVEIVEDGVHGYLVDNRNPSMFADRCIELLSDQKKRHRMAEAARQRVMDNFSRETMANQYYQLYQKLLD